MGVGAFAGSNTDFINEEYVPAQTVGFQLVPPTPPPPPPPHVCPPVSPQIQINPHQNRHVNTAHPELVRVSIFGTSGFDVNSILPGTVSLGGASPLGHFTRHINHDQYEDVTYVFRGDQISLPKGITPGTVSGAYVDSQGDVGTFSSSQTIYNKDASFYSPAQRAVQQHRQELRGVAPNFPPSALAQRAHQNHVDLVIDQTVTQQNLANWTGNGTTVSVPTAGRVGRRASTGSTPMGPRARLKAGHTGPCSGSAATSGGTSHFPDVKAMLRQQRIASKVAQVDYLNTTVTPSATVSTSSVAPASGTVPRSAA